MVLFALARLSYGYLVVFAETKKPDLGGVFFVSKLHHMFLGLGIYNILMIGVLSPSPVGRARSILPSLIALPSIIYTLYSARNFSENFGWEHLPLQEVVES